MPRWLQIVVASLVAGMLLSWVTPVVLALVPWGSPRGQSRWHWVDGNLQVQAELRERFGERRLVFRASQIRPPGPGGWVPPVRDGVVGDGTVEGLHLEAGDLVIKVTQGWPVATTRGACRIKGAGPPGWETDGVILIGRATPGLEDRQTLFAFMPRWPHFALSTIGAGVCLAAIVLAPRRYARRWRGHCVTCGYDTRSSAAEICAECGRRQPRHGSRAVAILRCSLVTAMLLVALGLHVRLCDWRAHGERTHRIATVEYEAWYWEQAHAGLYAGWDVERPTAVALGLALPGALTLAALYLLFDWRRDVRLLLPRAATLSDGNDNT